MSEWISIKKTTPKEEGEYLCCFDDGFVATASYRDNDWNLWADSGEVIAWMPLPEPYNVKDDNEVNVGGNNISENELLSKFCRKEMKGINNLLDSIKRYYSIDSESFIKILVGSVKIEIPLTFSTILAIKYGLDHELKRIQKECDDLDQ